MLAYSNGQGNPENSKFIDINKKPEEKEEFQGMKNKDQVYESLFNAISPEALEIEAGAFLKAVIKEVVNVNN
ncbi:MAG: hypothetical protein A3J51_04885 [Omnitrophica WOR_2 bacterium RIFCSPHIGHO2_02_FULL_45_21]|nr:MAG: hypothetical protein A3J51_04885 [Omnitrophica WOR_2 bacterium RIFCSPHIGHO2_02_FULL_45_21]